VTSRFDLDLGVTEAVVAANRKLDIQILRIADDHAAADVAERLEVPLGAPVLAVERVIRADDAPAAHALDVIPETALAGAGEARYEGGSVYRFLEERCGLELAGGIADVTATSAGRTLARQLGVSPGAALLRMEQVERTADEVAVLFSREHYVPTVFNLSVRRARRGGPAWAKEGGRPMSSQVDGHDEARELRSFGYEQQLSRSMGVFSSLSISISCMCIPPGIFPVSAYALSTAGPAFVWTRPVVAAGQILVALVLAELAGRLPLSGYAFQWTSSLARSRHR